MQSDLLKPQCTPSSSQLIDMKKLAGCTGLSKRHCRLISKADINLLGLDYSNPSSALSLSLDDKPKQKFEEIEDIESGTSTLPSLTSSSSLSSLISLTSIQLAKKFSPSVKFSSSVSSLELKADKNYTKANILSEAQVSAIRGTSFDQVILDGFPVFPNYNNSQHTQTILVSLTPKLAQ